MITIIGLGNPGAKFKNTRHNAGFMAVDFFAAQNDFPDFSLQKKSESLISSSFAKASADREKNGILLIKPQTFMNDSGRAVKRVIKDLRFKIQELVIIHDDIDMPLGKMKFSKDSGSGGHKGVDSIIQHLGTKNFLRLKIGVKTDEQLAENVVLKKFKPEEKEVLDEVVRKSAEALNYLIENGIEKTMNEFNR